MRNSPSASIRRTVLRERMAKVEKLRAEDKPTLPTTIGREKTTNPFLRSDDPAVMDAVGLAGADPAQVFAIRNRKDRSDPHLRRRGSSETRAAAASERRSLSADVWTRPAPTAAPIPRQSTTWSRRRAYVLAPRRRRRYRHFHAGAPFLLRRSDDSGPAETIRLGANLAAGERPRPSSPPVSGNRRRALASGRSFAARSPGFNSRASDGAAGARRPVHGDQDRDYADSKARPGEDGRRAQPPDEGGSDVPRHHGRGITARPSSPAWGSSTSTSYVERMRREYKVDVTAGKPQVAYSETITRPRRSPTPTRRRRAAPASTRAQGALRAAAMRCRPTSSRATSRAAMPREYVRRGEGL